MPPLLQSYWPLVQPMFDSVNIDDPDTFAVSSNRVPRPSLLLFAAHFCLSEVWNGGLLQFFWNSTGILAPEAIAGFDAIGMPTLAQVVRSAVATLGPTYPRERSKRWDSMLVNSGLSEQELAAIFKRTNNQFLAFKECTRAYQWDDLTDKLYDLAEEENGGFQQAATDFANRIRTE